MRSGVLSLALLALVSCSSDPEGTLQLTVGGEADTLTRTPAVTSLTVDSLNQAGAATRIASATLPAATIDLGSHATSDIVAFSVQGFDAQNNRVVRGETLYVQNGALDGQTLPVFLQRSGELARMPAPPAAFAATRATMVSGRYVFLTTGTTGMLYDLLSLTTLSSATTLPRVASAVAAVDTTVLLVDAAGASTFDLSSGAITELSTPNGGTFPEIAGGDRVGASDTSQYLVGGTRLEGDASQRVLAISAAGTASFASLYAPRLGACATYVDGRGLFVYGGSTTAAGAEILAPNGTVAAALPFPADPVKGCGAAVLDSTHVLVVGGTGATGDTGDGLPARVLDLACTSNCTPTAWPDKVKLTTAQVLPIAADAAFVVGDDADGATHAYRISASAGVREVTIKNPRRGARLVASPTGAFHVVGGNAPAIEQYLD